MSDKRYQVIYTGKLKPGLDAATVESNLVLSLGISEVKAKKLIASDRTLLKRCDSSVDAQVLVDKFDQAGILCVVADSSDNPGIEAGGESSLVRILKEVAPTSSNESPSLLKRLVGGGLKRRQA